MAVYYARIDGTSPDLASSVGPETVVSACMDIALHQSLPNNIPGDTLKISDIGGNTSVSKISPKSSATYESVNISNKRDVFSVSDAFAFDLFNKANITIRDIALSAEENVVRINGTSNLEISDVDFIDLSSIDRVIRLSNSAQTQINNIVVRLCKFLNMPNFAKTLFISTDTYQLVDFEYSGNVVSFGDYGIQFFSTLAGAGSVDLRPVRLLIVDNVFNNIGMDAFLLQSGCSWDGTEAGRSIIARNQIYNLGVNNRRASANGIGVQWCYGAIIEDNTIDVVETDLPDGHGIILDYAYSSTQHLTEACHIRRNIISRCVDGNQTAGIRVFRALNNFIYCNLSSLNTYGISIGSAESVNNVFANNTVLDNDIAAFGLNGVNGDPLGTRLINNIFLDGDYNLLVSNGMTTPARENNCYYGAKIQAIRASDGTEVLPESTAVTVDPRFVDRAGGDFNLQEDSPCVGVGSKWWGNKPRPRSLNGESLPDTGIDLGSCQSKWHPSHPGNPNFVPLI